MRKSALIFLTIIIVVVGVLVYFLQDRFIERAIERTGEAVVGAKVEIDGFDFSLFDLSCSWQRLQIANPNDPWRNLLETGRAAFAIEMRPLFWGRILIDELALEEVRSGSCRSTDGSLPVAPGEAAQPGLAEKATRAVNKRITELAELDLSALARTFKIDSLVDPQMLNSVQGYQEFTSDADSTFGHWRSQFTGDSYQRQLRDFEIEISQLKPDSVQNDVVAMAEMVKKLDALYQRVTQLKQQIGGQGQAIKNDFQSIQTRLSGLQDAVQADIEMAKRRANLQGLEVKDVALALFGEPVIARIEHILHYVGLGRKYLPAASVLLTSEEEPNPPRFEGQDIYFPFHYRYPRLLIRKIHLSGMTAAGDSTRGYALDGQVLGFTTEPPVYGQPTKFDVKFYRESSNQYAIRGVLDHVDAARDSLWISASQIRLGEQSLPSSKYLPASFTAQRGSFELSGFFAGDAININFGFQATPVTFRYASEASGKIESIVRSVLADINRIDLTATLAGRQGDYALRMGSNIDNALSNGVMSVLDQNFRAAQAQLETRVRASVARYRSEAESRVQAFRQGTLAEVEQLQQRVQAELERIEQYKKEIENCIEAEKKKAEQKVADEKKKLEEKAKKGLEGLLKKKKN
ncbi:MAG: TIGR03545 family protein [Deferribacteres bacterium]|nr:TIGR03545 family protein [candidate division KSB1 bacterium]MCB9511684.1 TIGR03545 family protein [Deferribacteres bacterium]